MGKKRAGYASSEQTGAAWLLLVLILVFLATWVYSERANIVNLVVPPTPTPFPSFVSGEERFAFDSFVRYFGNGEFLECVGGDDYDIADYGFSDEYEEGRAIYLGDGYWRFHIRTFSSYGSDESPTYYYHEQTYEVQSLTTEEWGNVCGPLEKGKLPPQNFDEEFDEPKDYDPFFDSGPGDF